MAETIVGSALLRVLQHIIGLVDGLEVSFRFLATVLAVGVIFHGELAKSRLDRRIVGGARNAQQFVIVLLDHHPSPLRSTGPDAAPDRKRRQIIIPYSLHRLQKIRRRPLLPEPRRAAPKRPSSRHRDRRRPRFRLAAPCTWPRRASSPPESVQQSSAASHQHRRSRPLLSPRRALSRCPT